MQTKSYKSWNFAPMGLSLRGRFFPRADAPWVAVRTNPQSPEGARYWGGKIRCRLQFTVIQFLLHLREVRYLRENGSLTAPGFR